MTEAEKIAASVRQRLKNLTGTADFQTMLVLYALERLLYRLGRSPYQTKFVLKGALLFNIWLERPWRSTRDADLLGFGDNSPERIEEIFRELDELLRQTSDDPEARLEYLRAERAKLEIGRAHV